MAEQINVFVENKPGRIRKVTEILFEEKINIRAIVIQDRTEFGVMKILVDAPRKAQLALADQGFACALKSILAIAMDDTPGGLFKVLSVLEEKGINILDAYGFVVESKKLAVWCVEVENQAEAKAAVESWGFRVLRDTEIYEL